MECVNGPSHNLIFIHPVQILHNVASPLLDFQHFFLFCCCFCCYLTLRSNWDNLEPENNGILLSGASKGYTAQKQEKLPALVRH